MARTMSDQKVDEATEHVRKAIRAVSAVVVDECDGTIEYASDYMESLFEAMQQLIGVKKKLNSRWGIDVK